jgi:uncharacterized protein
LVETLPIVKPSRIHRLFYHRGEPRAVWRLLIFLGIVVALGYATNFSVRRLLHGADDTTLFLVRELLDFLIFLAASWIMGRIECRTIGQYGLPARRMFRLRFWQGALLGFASITCLVSVMRAVGVFSFGSIALHGADVLKWAIVWALVFILVALREEFRARGYALFTLSSITGFWPAAILSAAFFGYSHHGNTGEDWIGLFNAAAFGLLLSFLLRRTGNLWMPIGFHATFDWGETYFYGVPDSGQVTPGHLLNSTFSGLPWLSGGTVGPEGSVLCTLLIIPVWLICAAWLRQSRYPDFSSSRNPRSALSD